MGKKAKKAALGQCSICGIGQMQPGGTTVTLERDGGVVVIREVPAHVCEACGEYYLTPDVADHVLARAERALADGGEVGIVRYAA